MKLAFSTNAYKKTTLEAAIDSIARIGYAGVEIMADIPHAYPPNMPPERIAQIRAQLTRLKLPISNINAFTLFALGDTYHPSWIDNDPNQIAQRIQHTQNVMQMSAQLNPHSVLSPGGGQSSVLTISLEPGGPLGSISRVTALRRYEAGLRQCLPLAQQLGLILLIEPEPDLMIEHSWDCIALLEKINHPHLKMNCDLGHFYCVNEDPAEVVRHCAKWIAHIHLEDIKADRVHQHRIPGEGAMDWPKIFSAIRDIHYQGWITVELYPYESTAEQAAQKAFDFLQPFIR